MTAIATPSELQKAEEYLALTRFREASDQLTGTLDPVVQDPPDFLITDGSSHDLSRDDALSAARRRTRLTRGSARGDGNARRRTRKGNLRGGTLRRLRERQSVLQDQRNQAS